MGECVVAQKMAGLEGTGSSTPPAHTPPYASLPSGCSRSVPFKINQSVQEEEGGGKREKNVHLISEERKEGRTERREGGEDRPQKEREEREGNCG